jgi:hypothetical protein
MAMLFSLLSDIAANNDCTILFSHHVAGRLNEWLTPSVCKVANMVAPFIGLPLSECSTTCAGAMHS